MARLRQPFDQARQAYRSTGYPGDLSDDVLGPVPTVRGRAWPALTIASLAGLAVAALVLLVVRPAGLDTPTDRPDEVAGPTTFDPAAGSDGAVAATDVPTLWNTFESVPSFAALWADESAEVSLGASEIPTFPSLADLTDETTLTFSEEDL
jgi:hypothetical protein